MKKLSHIFHSVTATCKDTLLLPVRLVRSAGEENGQYGAIAAATGILLMSGMFFGMNAAFFGGITTPQTFLGTLASTYMCLSGAMLILAAYGSEKDQTAVAKMLPDMNKLANYNPS